MGGGIILDVNMINGIVIGMVLNSVAMLLSALINQYYYKNTLALKSRQGHRTSEKIGDNFYYIVPADEYLEMEQAWLFKKFDNMKAKEKIND